MCSAHPEVIRAALQLGRDNCESVLTTATYNQINQDGGYNCMTPAGFCDFVKRIAQVVGFETAALIFGGDHLVPNHRKHLPASEAMTKAQAMVAAYAEAGFSKRHLDCPMGCAGETEALADEIVANRAA